MSLTIDGHFDGSAIIPDKPLQLVPGQRVRERIESMPDTAYPLSQIADLAMDMGVPDLADRHDDFCHNRKANP
jgi:hypothetical protein